MQLVGRNASLTVPDLSLVERGIVIKITQALHCASCDEQRASWSYTITSTPVSDESRLSEPREG